MADKIVVLNNGRIEQVGAPMELYHRPRTEFVAGFIGAPSMNFLEVENRGAHLLAGGAPIKAAARGTEAVRLGIRPEHIAVVEAGKGDFDATVTLRETLGGDAFLYVRMDGGATLIVRAEGDTELDSGRRIGLRLPAERLHFFDRYGQTINSGGAHA